MRFQPLQSSCCDDRPAARRLPSRAYILCVVGVAVFVAGLGIWHAPESSSTIRAVVVYEVLADGDPQKTSPLVRSEALSQLVSEALSAEQVGKAVTAGGVDEALLVDQRGSKWTGRESSDPAVERLRRRLDAKVEPGLVPERAKIHFEYDGPNEDQATALLDAIAAQFVESVSDTYHAAAGALDEDREKRETELAAAQSQLREAKQALETLVDNELDALLKPQADDPAEPPNEIQRETVEPPAETRRRDPRWLELRRRLTSLEAQQELLLIHRTPAHPDVAATQQQIDRLATLLKSIPEFLQGQSQALATPAPANRPARSDLGSPASVDEDDRWISPAELKAKIAKIETSEAYMRRHAEYAAAQRRVDELLARQQVQDRTPPAIEMAKAKVWKPAHVLRRHQSSMRPSQMLLLASGALMAAYACAVFSVSYRSSPYLTGPSDVQQSLGLEIAGSLATTDGPELPCTGPALSSPVRGAIHLSEGVLMAALALVLVMIVLDRSFASQLAEDPFTAFSCAVRRAIHWLI